MIRDLLKWVVPGLVTVLGGTTLSLAMTAGDISSNLAAQSAEAMRAGGYDWAELSFDMRDVALSGTTSDLALSHGAAARLAAIPGVRIVSSDVTLAPPASPYRLEASIANGNVGLAGAVPDEATRLSLLAHAGLEQGALELRSGMPERAAWVAGAKFAIEQLKYLDQGTVSVSDLTLALNGRARSERDFRDLLIVMRAGPPAGVTLGEVTITPALVSPYEWRAVSDGKRIDVSGYVPDDALIERFRTAAVSGLPVATGLALGSGEPDGFAELSQKLIEQLSKLEYGTATITDGVSTLTGAPPSVELAQAVVNDLQSAGSIIVLDPPMIPDYWVSATRQPGGVTVFDGYAPDEATRTALGQRQGADINWLKLGRGAPDRYQSAVEFGLSALERMSEGRFALRANVMTLTGTARSVSDYQALLSTMTEAAPQGLVLARAEIVAPRAEQFVWSARKAADGAIALSGMVATPEARVLLVSAAGPAATDTIAYASGEPNNFLPAAQTGLGLLERLGEGTISFDGAGWLITGTAGSASDKAALEAEFSTRQLAAAGWSMAIAEPVQVAAPEAEPEPAPEPVAEAPAPEPVAPAVEAPVAAAPVVEPAPQPEPVAPPAVDPDYAFSSTRNADGSVILSGQLPAEATVRFFATLSKGDTAAVSVADGAPDGFVPGAEAGMRALLLLDEGQLDFANGRWSLTGTASDVAKRDAVLAAIALDGANTWSTTIALPAEPVVATPAPAAPAPAAAKVDIAACRDPLADFSARNAILFQSGAALIAAESQPALDELALDLAACPDAVVHIEGHTDADGDDQLNLALSVARAEAVVDALVSRGVTPARLFAVGYGESKPIADNGTSAGKRLNRRIVVTVSDEHY